MFIERYFEKMLKKINIAYELSNKEERKKIARVL